MRQAAQNAGLKSETITFTSLPTNLAELTALPEADLSSPFKTAALAVAVLNNYEADQAATYEMLNWLRGPNPLPEREKQFIRDRLGGKMYVIRSFWAGTSPQNNYTPSEPYSVTFFEDPYTYQNAGYAKLNVRSSGADSPRQITLRKKESTGQWFVWEIFFLSDIRIPVAMDEWA
ncbi:MAG: hypothetical protein IKQ92_02485 [Clostridia bacterium]|nr:hypothetical protein [Clostridia bacterium]